MAEFIKGRRATDPPEPVVSEVMTTSAFLYLLGVIVQNILLGVLCMFFPQSFKSKSFESVMAYAPLDRWGAAFFFVGIFATIALCVRRGVWPALAIGFSALVAGVWGICYIVGMIQGTSTGWIGPIWIGSIVYKDAITITRPLRTALEPALRRLEERTLEGA